MRRVFSYVCLVVLISSIFVPAILVSAESDWTLLDSDRNEGGSKNDWKDVQYSFYNFSSNLETVNLRLDCYGLVGNDWPTSGGRYKWFIDTSDPVDMYLSGGNIEDADYLIYVEDSDDDGTGEMYFVKDSDSDSSFNDEAVEPVSDSFFTIKEYSII